MLMNVNLKVIPEVSLQRDSSEPLLLRSTGLSNLLQTSFKKSRFSSTRLNTGFIAFDVFKAIIQLQFSPNKLTLRKEKEEVRRKEKQRLLVLRYAQMRTRSYETCRKCVKQDKVYSFRTKKVRRKEFTYLE